VHYQVCSDPTSPMRRRGKSGATTEAHPTPPTWPVARRQVRAWMEPWIMLRRYWQVWSVKLSPRQLPALLDWVWQGKPIYLYVR
jgi:hypothetical protein